MFFLWSRHSRQLFYNVFFTVFAFSCAVVAQENTTSAQTPQLIEQAFDDWVYRCVLPPDGAETDATPACELSQSVLIKPPSAEGFVQSDELVEVLNLTLSRANDKAGNVDWALIVLTPLDVHLAADFALVIGKNEAILARYRNCNHQGCWVVVPINNAALNGLKRASEAVAGFQMVNGQKINISFSLIGFTKAFSAFKDGVLPSAENDVAR